MIPPQGFFPPDSPSINPYSDSILMDAIDEDIAISDELWIEMEEEDAFLTSYIKVCHDTGFKVTEKVRKFASARRWWN